MKISIIIPTYNHLEDCLKPCIQSLIKHTDFNRDGIEVEIVIVANGCTDGTVDYIKTLPDGTFKSLEFAEPLGYPRAINAALGAVRSDYYLLLNNDTAIQDGWPKNFWIDTLLDTFKKYPKSGVVGVLPHFEPTVQVDFIIFCEVMISDACLAAVGYLDESLTPGGGEDVDFCIRARQCGFECRELESNPKAFWSSNRYISNYPLYHAASQTVHALPDWQGTFDRNMNKLRERYKVGSRTLDPKKISIIIPTLNHLEDCLKPCCDSIARNTSMSDDIEVIIVANGCTDGTKAYVQSLDKRFKLTEYPEAMGYPRAINAGLHIARGDYIVLLNNDTIIQDWAGIDGWLKILQAPFLNDPTVGLTGPALQRNHEIGKDFLIFFCVMFSRKVYDEIGPLDEAFSPGAGEDTAFCIEAQRKGYKLVQVPGKTTEDGKQIIGEFPLYHKAEATVNDLPDWKEVFRRNGDILMKRYGKALAEATVVEATPVVEPPKEVSRETKLANWDGHNTERAVISRRGNIPPRELARYEWVKRNITGSKVLEIGCSSGYGLRLFGDIEGLDYTGVDYNADIIEYARENFGDMPGVKFLQQDISKGITGHYDTIVALEVLEHLPNGREIAQRLKRHCDTLLISVPYKEAPGYWGVHHKIHQLEERDFPDFDYFYMTTDAEVQKQRLDQGGQGLLLMRWTSLDEKAIRGNPKVAVITPYYNDPGHIFKAIESVKNQTYPAAHFVYDDGSQPPLNMTDVHLTRSDQNLGQSNARNMLIAKALEMGYDLVAFLDSDDVWEPDHLETSITALQNNMADVVYNKPVWQNEAGEPIVFFGFGRPRQFIGKQLESSNFIWISGVVAKAKCFDNNTFDSKLDSLEDWDMWYRLNKQGYRFHYTGRETFTYLVRDSGQAGRGTAVRPLVVQKHGLKMQGTRLNVACGDDYQEGYINADLYSTKKYDAIFDVQAIPYDDGTVDEIRALHIIEHFNFHESNALLKEWYRVLRPGGKLIIETPDFLKSCDAFVKGDINFRVMLYGHFFAWPWLPGQVHKFLFTEDQLRVQLGWAGFKSVTRIEPISGYVRQDTKDLFLTVEAYK